MTELLAVAGPVARRDRAWLVLLLALPVLVHLPELSGLVSSDPLLLTSGLGTGLSGGLLSGQPGWIDGNAGVTVQALGRLVARDWMAGIVPWWNPYTGVGVPLAGEYQPAAFFLPWVLLLGLPNGVLLLKLALQMIAGVGCWALGRRLGFARPVAAMAGVLFAFNGSFAWASDAPIQPMAFLPWILLGIERVRAGRSWLPLGLGLGMSLLAGFPETAFLDGLLALGWALLRLGQAWGGPPGGPGGRRAGAVGGMLRGGPGPGRLAFRLALRLGLGGGFGLLLAAPQLAAFLDLLPDAFVGSHGAGMQAPLPAAGFAMWLMPWLHGPIFFDGHGLLWFALGGYVGAAPVLLALAGRRERRLRLLLAGWVVLVVGKSAAWPPLAALADAVPLMAHTLVSRYATASAGLAIILLAGLGVEDWRRAAGGLGLRRRAVGLGGFGGLVAVCLVAAWPVSREVMQVSGGRIAWMASLLLLVGVALSLTVLLGRPAGRRTVATAVGIVSVEALLLFSLPLLSGRTGGQLDVSTLAFLRGHLGLQRFTTLGGTLTPNYGAYWGLASINHNLIPVPRAWTGYLQAAIDPGIDPIQFYGADGGSEAGIERRAGALLPHLQALEALGVAYLLQDHGVDRLALPALPVAGRADAEWAGLDAGGMLSARYPTGGTALEVGRVSVVVGTFAGQASGPLQVTLCSGSVCGRGEASLDRAVDNAPLPVVLDRLVQAGAGQTLRLTLAHPSGRGVAIWLWHNAGATVPRLALSSASAPVLVHVGTAADIYAFAHPAAYADAGPGCRIGLLGRTLMQADCATPSRLVRRELFLPGWQARVGNGGWRPVQREGTLFQAVALPAGRSSVRFAYAPPHAALGWAGLLLAGSMAVMEALRCRAGRAARQTKRGLT